MNDSTFFALGQYVENIGSIVLWTVTDKEEWCGMHEPYNSFTVCM